MHIHLYAQSQRLVPNQVSAASSLGSLSVTWKAPVSELDTLMIYDLDSPSGVYLHMLEINVHSGDVNTGNIVVPYELPNPPYGEHRYIVAVARQSRPLKIDKLSRLVFDVDAFVQQHDLSFQTFETLVVNRERRTFYLDVRLNDKHAIIQADSDLSDEQQKFCSCVIDVAVKQPSACNFEKAWFEKREGAMCYNPFAVCAKSIGTSTRACNSNYNFDAMNDAQLEAFGNLYNVSWAGDRLSMIKLLHDTYDV